MAKSVRKTAERLKKEKYTALALVVNAAIDLGSTTRTAICEAAGIQQWELTELFKFDKELYGKFCIRRKTLVHKAADNLDTILNDPNHPQHFAASKYILQTYVSDLDENLEAKQSGNQIGISVQGGSKRSPVRIQFTGAAKK